MEIISYTLSHSDVILDKLFFIETINWTTSLGLIVLFIVWYYLFWKPYDLFRDFTEFGYQSVREDASNYSSSDKNRRLTINTMRQRRKLGDLPPPFPNGWFAVIESSDLASKTAKECYVLGLNLVVWRGESGEAFVADAYCPHLGAHLGVGGKVDGDCITCPFHGWTFSGKKNGENTLIPYSNKVLDFIKLKMYKVIERNGFVFIWYHADGEDPNWEPKVIPEIDSGHWRYRGRSEFRVTCHCQEMPENGADVNHLNIVHVDAIMVGGKPDESFLKCLIKQSLFKHVWAGDWTTSKLQDEEHVGILTLSHKIQLFNRISFMEINVVAKQYGPGLVYLEFNTVLGRGILFHMVTPIEGLLQRVTHRFYSAPTFIHPYGKLILLGEAIMIERDISIWNRKTFIGQPKFSKEDRKIKEFRKWYSQFYSPKSFDRINEYFGPSELTSRRNEDSSDSNANKIFEF